MNNFLKKINSKAAPFSLKKDSLFELSEENEIQ